MPARTVPAERPSVSLPAQPREAPPAMASVSAPAGTDPDLWSVLTTEERAHFARLGAMGPLTYGRVLSGQMTAPASTSRGGRVDVRA